MTPSSSSLPVPPDPTCAICSKPIRSGFIHNKGGEAIHIRCRTQQLQVDALDQGDRARLAIERATDLVGETRRRRSAQFTGRNRQREPCPVCRGSATLTDWRPHLNWMTVENCPCDGFFVWTPLLDDGRLDRLTQEDRETLSQRIGHLRLTESEAWLTTPGRHRDGGLDHPHRAAGRPNLERSAATSRPQVQQASGWRRRPEASSQDGGMVEATARTGLP